MAAHRRLFGVLGILLLVVLVAGGTQAGRTPAALAQVSTGSEVFLPLVPPKLYAGDPSHPGLAEATGALGLNGYCIDVQGDGIDASTMANFGFRVDPALGQVLSADFDDNGSPGDTADDVYCVVVVANQRPAGTPLPGDPYEPNKPLVITWEYYDAAADATFLTVSDPIPVVEVRLVGFDGVVGGRALVCTEGWDTTFLTGAASDAAEPDPLNKVALSDWNVLTGGVAIIGTPFFNTTDFTTVNPADANSPLPRSEWCLTVVSAAPVSDIDVTLSFVAVYDRNTDFDDLAVTVSSDGAGIDIVMATSPELRHEVGGNLIESQLATPNALYSTHTACVLPTVPGDTLDSVFGIDGTVSSYHDSDPTNGIPDGTLCISWSESRSGREAVSTRVDLSAGNYLGPDDNARAVWDTNQDHNGYLPNVGELLLKDWYVATTTVITTGGTPDDGVVTNGSIDVGVVFNAGTGGFYGRANLNEWVFGALTVDETENLALLDGVRVVLTIEGCGQFAGDGIAPGTVQITTMTNAGLVPFTFDVDGSGAAVACVPGDESTITIDTFYANGHATAAPRETVTLVIAGPEAPFYPPETAPQLVWAGQTVTIFYGFAGSGCGDLTATFTRSKTQEGAFIVRGGRVDGADFVSMPFDDDDCSATVQYERETPGEVDIVATFTDTDPSDGITSGEYSKVVFPLFFLAIEDVTATADEALTVSEQGTLEAVVRAWFPGTNPSGRPEELKEDGRTLPADRWVLPDDWSQLRGPSENRPSWPSSAQLPPLQVTFYMTAEPIRNSFGTETRGAAGFFITDGDYDEFSYNTQPQTGETSVLGSNARPRIINEMTDTNGAADTGIFGDFNLHFADCAVNARTGNPYCEPGDIVGNTTYYAIAEYPGWRGLLPPIASNQVSTEFSWQGYKQVSVIDTADPGVKYVVAHLRDRDGYCNAIGLHNVLGNVVRFDIDAGGGIILDAESEPSFIEIDRRSATGVTFDTLDDLGNAMNVDIAQPVLQEDECQAWVKISNSLLTATNVLVTFPAPPVPLPGDVRITNLVCGPSGSVTVTNLSDHAVSLAGFGVRSGRAGNPPEEHLGLAGVLGAGESATYPANEDVPWLDAASLIFAGGNDYARLVWNEFEISARTCNGAIIAPPFVADFPLDTEGEIVLDVTVRFGEQSSAALQTGWNLVTATGNGNVESLLGSDAAKVGSIYAWDAASGTWERYVPGAPSFVNTLQTFEEGSVYWVEVNQPFTLRMTR